MDKQEILKKIKTIEINSNIIANNIFSGSYHSCFKGNGMEFAEIRRYSPGDDVKKIDWKVTARQRKAYIKEFVEERELSIFLVIDMSESNSFWKKKEMIGELLATLGFSANKNDDKVGALFFTDRVEKFIPLKKGKKHTLSILNNFLTLETKGNRTNIDTVLSFFNKVVKKKSIVFLISDFLDENYEKSLKITESKHDLIPIRILERGNETLPKGAIFELIDSETGEEIIIENLKEDISLSSNLKMKKSITIFTDEDYIKALLQFFNQRRG
ncbi:MAG: DUF58 domain-containing protein [Fusobacteriaceae bacterium]